MTNPAAKNLTFISRRAPYGEHYPQLCLDMVLASAVFEQNINYVFMGDGIYQLLKGQDGASVMSKTLGKALEALELYGVETILVDKESLTQRGLTSNDLLIDVKLQSKAEIAQLIDISDAVFNL